jgi:hypothetical protein
VVEAKFGPIALGNLVESMEIVAGKGERMGMLPKWI